QLRRCAAPASSSHSASSSSASTRPARMPYGTRGAASPPSAVSARLGAKVGRPSGAATPAGSKVRSAIACPTGSGTAWAPSAMNSGKASARSAPAPPASSGAINSRNPDCPISRHSASCAPPASMARTTAGPHWPSRRSSKASLYIAVMLPPSTQAQAAGDHAAQDLARAAPQRVSGTHLVHVGAGAQQLAVDIGARVRAQRGLDGGRYLLLEGGAQVLDQRGLDRRALAGGQPRRDRQRQVAQRRQVGGVAADRRRQGGLAPAAQPLDPAVQQHDAGINALRPAALEGQLGGDLLPAAAFAADQRV